ncbi:short-chain fatty acyl-CoA regulator family protein [Tropicimonas sp. S265A]|uniref:short-chain fatty acyl-CoA regulator family protein n=1 Tax=Tropicimonas sp. S265A TaxID=3415134 RepID=UPI003C7D7313
MPKSALTGSRIRERRQSLKIKQAELAAQVEISPSYLNLIEHNRRRIGGKVLLDIARALKIEATALTEGAEETLLEGLRDAVAASRRSTAELDRLEEFVARFPGWAQLIAAQRRRIVTQNRTIEALNDRLTHDPFLAEAMHELLSNVTAIRSTASILAQTPEIEDAWRDRFHRNLFEESDRLAEGSQSLVSYFDKQATERAGFATPLEALESLLEERRHHLAELEAGGVEAIPDLIASVPQLGTPQARALAQSYFQTYARDAGQLPAKALADEAAHQRDPAQLARKFDVPLPQLMHRLACLPRDVLGWDVGLVVADTSGSLLYRKGVDGFPVPRFGAACTLWPVYRALARPTVPVFETVETPPGRRFSIYAYAEAYGSPDFTAPTVMRSYMLVMPDREGDQQTVREIGTTCRICPRDGCIARREPSILAG